MTRGCGADRRQVRRGAGPRGLAAMRNTAIAVVRRAGHADAAPPWVCIPLPPLPTMRSSPSAFPLPTDYEKTPVEFITIEWKDFSSPVHHIVLSSPSNYAILQVTRRQI